MSSPCGPKAIETHYRGCRFRSRLEARWAVFLDALGVRWVYEREGYDLGPAGWYLPDFWLPDLDSWLEIKPTTPKPDERAKMLALAQATDKLVFVFFDCMPPRRVYDGDGFYLDSVDYGQYHAPGNDWDGMQAFGWCDSCRRATVGHEGSHQRFCPEQYDTDGIDCNGQGDDALAHTRVASAFTAASSARFEHGDKSSLGRASTIFRRGE